MSCASCTLRSPSTTTCAVTLTRDPPSGCRWTWCTRSMPGCAVSRSSTSRADRRRGVRSSRIAVALTRMCQVLQSTAADRTSEATGSIQSGPPAASSAPAATTITEPARSVRRWSRAARTAMASSPCWCPTSRTLPPLTTIAMMPMTMTATPSTGSGFARRLIDSTTIQAIEPSSSSAETKPPSASALPNPNDHVADAGRRAMRRAITAVTRPSASTAWCAASASTTTAPMARPTTTCTTEKPTLSAAAPAEPSGRRRVLVLVLVLVLVGILSH